MRLKSTGGYSKFAVTVGNNNVALLPWIFNDVLIPGLTYRLSVTFENTDGPKVKLKLEA